jgi:hypothetical protein
VRCYNHSNHEAVGICKACGKGLCTDCVVDVGVGLSCRGEHEQRVVANDALISRASRVQDSAGKARYFLPAFFGFIGIVACTYGLMQQQTDVFLVLIGGVFLVFGTYLLVINRRAYGTHKTGT